MLRLIIVLLLAYKIFCMCTPCILIICVSLAMYFLHFYPDCFVERSKAEESERNDPDAKIFVPECRDGGLFRREQCHKHTGYCFCVDEHTGRHIPGTSIQHSLPDCSNAEVKRQIEGL